MIYVSLSFFYFIAFGIIGSRKSKLVIPPITELTAKQVDGICRQTNLTDSEVRRRHLAFLEQYTDGLITREQLYDNLTEVCPEDHIETDQNRNGLIDFVEFISITHKSDSNDNCEKNDEEQIFLGLLFDMFDRNHDGYLEKHELKPLIESIYDLAGSPNDERRGMYSTHAQVKYLLEKLDKNGDKRLSKQEFIDHENWTDDERLGRFFVGCYAINDH